MTRRLKQKLDRLMERHEELSALLSDPSVINEQNTFRDYSREYAELEPVVNCHRQWHQAQTDIESATLMREDSDADMRAMAEEELTDAQARAERLEDQLQQLMLPKDPRDAANVFLEIRAGTGGDEAAIFAGDLFRMYSRYADQQGWRVEIISSNDGEHGGYKEIISRIHGQGAYSKLKFESGAHRVQRVPATESQGRVHTSACTVAVMAEAEDLGRSEEHTSELQSRPHLVCR